MTRTRSSLLLTVSAANTATAIACRAAASACKEAAATHGKLMQMDQALLWLAQSQDWLEAAVRFELCAAKAAEEAEAAAELEEGNDGH